MLNIILCQNAEDYLVSECCKYADFKKLFATFLFVFSFLSDVCAPEKYDFSHLIAKFKFHTRYIWEHKKVFDLVNIDNHETGCPF